MKSNQIIKKFIAQVVNNTDFLNGWAYTIKIKNTKTILVMRGDTKINTICGKNYADTFRNLINYFYLET
jgi:hypothetical protein